MTDTPFPEQRATLPDEWRDCFDTLTAQGRAPISILATIEYVTTPRTQGDVGDEYDVSTPTIRNLQAAVVALGPVDATPKHKWSSMTRMDYCNHIADTLGWEEDSEYTVSRAGNRETPQPALRKAGWSALYTAVCLTDSEDPDV